MGSTNHRAAVIFANQHDWKEPEIVPLTNSYAVLSALSNGEIDFGTMAWESRSGLVSESVKAAKTFQFEQLDELTIEINHSLFVREGVVIDTSEVVEIHSHPQALAEHESFLRANFGKVLLIPEEDTALSAEQLSMGSYPDNSLVVAPNECAELYNLESYLTERPSNKGYWVKILLVKSAV